MRGAVVSRLDCCCSDVEGAAAPWTYNAGIIPGVFAAILLMFVVLAIVFALTG
ncbi:MAG TPA: hypothetical protein VJ828_08100 [Lacipirellulaceae bacterium]|nr:hypothetical protein [Lacipirellulaceae bacterium]